MSDGPTSCPYCGAPVTPPEKGPVEKYMTEPMTRPAGKPKAEPAERPAFQPASESKAEPVYKRVYAEEPPKQSNKVAVVGFVMSIIALLTSGIVGIGLLLSIPGLILSSIGISKSKKSNASNKGFAVAGVVISILAIIFSVVSSSISITVDFNKYLDKAHEASISLSHHYYSDETD